MSINKNVLDNYLKDRENGNLQELIKKSKYSHNKVFDEPSYVKNKNINKKAVLLNDISTDNNLHGIQIEKNDNSMLLMNYASLVGVQKKIVNFIYNSCKVARNKFTEPISIEYLSEKCKTTKPSAKKNLQRLEKKGVILRKMYKDGRGGWTRYELNERIFQEILNQESLSKSINDVKDRIDVINEESNNVSVMTELPNDWLKIDLSDSAKFGFTDDHLLQLHRTGNYDPKLIERSLEYFLFDLENNSKLLNIKTDPVSYFMGIMKRSGAYLAPNNYQSKKEIAMLTYIKNEKNIQEREKNFEEEIVDLEFKKWITGLSEEEKQKIIPNDLRNISISAPKIAALRTYFKNNIFKSQKNVFNNNVSIVEK